MSRTTVVAAGIVAILAWACAAPATQYTMTDLGALGGSNTWATGINNVGQIVGQSGEHAFLYSGGVMQDLGTLGGAWSLATSINDAGQVVGASDTVGDVNRHAFLYSGGVMSDLGTLGVSLNYAYATGISNAGQVVGQARATASNDHAFLYSGGVMQDLGTLGGAWSSAMGINNAGQVVGVACLASGAQHAFLYSGGVMQDLGTLGWRSGALGINNVGQVVGDSHTTVESTPQHAFLYSNGVMHDLGTLGGTYGSAYSINNAGQIVGESHIAGNTAQHAFLYSGGVMTDLNSLIPANSGLTLAGARSINDRGQIAGYAWEPSGLAHAILLTPIPVVTPRPDSQLPQTASPHPLMLPTGAERLRQYVSEVGAWGLFLPSTFDASKPTYVITHDGEKALNPLLHDSQLADMSAIAAAIKARDPGANVLGWNWEDREAYLDRMSARRAVYEQGPLLAQALREIGIQAETTAFIGHGIGGHLVASAAASLTGASGSKAERVVLLDTPMFWEFRGVPGQRSISQELRVVGHVDNYYYGSRPAEDRYLAGEGQPVPELQVFNADLDYRLPSEDGHKAVIPWYAEAISQQRVDLQGNHYGIKLDGLVQDALTHERVGSFYESYLLLEGYLINSSDTAAKGLELWKAIPDIIPFGINLLDSLESWSGCHATPVDVLAGNRHSTTAVELRESSDAYIWKQVALAQDCAYLAFDAMFLGEVDGDELVVTFDDETLFRGDGSLFDELLWTNSGPIPIADLAGRTGILQFWLKSSGDPNLSVLIDNVGFVTPEPGTLSLMAAATTVLAFVRRRRPS
ncbi:MAG: DUF3466 family protein [Planctomycetes bacterium]|nr:DUF3466 family protein [Planctomycetota bacterium]